MNEQIQQMFDVATGVMNGVFISMGKPDVYFKKMIELERGGENDLLVVGSVHRDYDDGHCVAVLNPDSALVEQLNGGVAYNGPILKDLVAGRCKAMVFVTCTGRRTYLASKYRSRKQ
jgi:hypothetical protein